MVEIKVTGNTPLEALSSLVAFGMRAMQIDDVCAAAHRILEAEQHEEKKLTTTQAKAAPNEPESAATPTQQEAPVQEPASDIPQTAPAPAETNGPTPAPGDAPEPVPTVEQVRAKGIETSRKYGKETVVAVLQKFGVKGMSDLAEKDRAAFLTELERLGAGNA